MFKEVLCSICCVLDPVLNTGDRPMNITDKLLALKNTFQIEDIIKYE